MNLRDPFVRGRKRLDPDKATEQAAALQTSDNRAQAVRRFGMTGSHIMFKILRMINKSGAPHDLYFHCRRRFDHATVNGKSS